MDRWQTPRVYSGAVKGDVVIQGDVIAQGNIYIGNQYFYSYISER